MTDKLVKEIAELLWDRDTNGLPLRSTGDTGETRMMWDRHQQDARFLIESPPVQALIEKANKVEGYEGLRGWEQVDQLIAERDAAANRAERLEEALRDAREELSEAGLAMQAGDAPNPYWESLARYDALIAKDLNQ